MEEIEEHFLMLLDERNEAIRLLMESTALAKKYCDALVSQKDEFDKLYQVALQYKEALDHAYGIMRDADLIPEDVVEAVENARTKVILH